MFVSGQKHTFHSPAHHLNLEVEQQSNLPMTQLHVTQQLCPMDWKELFDGLEFHNDTVVNKKIKLVPGPQLHTLVLNRKLLLLLEGDSPQGEFTGHAGLGPTPTAQAPEFGEPQWLRR
jgi:hypothetical protein